MFYCDKCGECCRHLPDLREFNELNRGDGVCKYLYNNLCSIYETRPLLCRVDDSYESIFKSYMTKEVYYNYNREICKRLKEAKSKGKR